MNIAQYTPERITDRFMIQDLMYRWCRAVDRLDRQAMLDIFWPGAIDSHGPYIGPADRLVDWILVRHKPIKTSSHFVGNMLIEFATPDLALMETYVRTIQQYPPDGKQSLAQLTGGATGDPDNAMDMFTSSRYMDHVERRDGQWRVARRDLEDERDDRRKALKTARKEGNALRIAGLHDRLIEIEQALDAPAGV